MEMIRRIRRTAKGSFKWLIYSIIHTKLNHQGAIQRHLISVPGGAAEFVCRLFPIPLRALGWTAQRTANVR